MRSRARRRGTHAQGVARLAAASAGRAGAGLPVALKPWLGNACRFEPTCSAYALEALRRHGAMAGSRARRGAAAALPPLVPGRPRPRAATGAAILHPTVGQDTPMTDMRRTLLWVVFAMSLVLLWDAWNKHTGAPSLFGAQPSARRPRPLRRRCRAAACRHRPRCPARPPAPPAAPAAASRRRRRGARCRRRDDHADHRPREGDHRQPRRRARAPGTAAAARPVRPHAATWCCSTAAASACTWRAAGWPRSTAWPYPNHETVMTEPSPGPRELAAGADTLELQARVARGRRRAVCARPTRFKRGDYRIGVKHEVVNAAPTSR